MRKEFDESLLLDGVKRTELEAVIRSHASREALYSPEEEAIMEGGRNSFKVRASARKRASGSGAPTASFFCVSEEERRRVLLRRKQASER
jgi:hypothetical protein